MSKQSNSTPQAQAYAYEYNAYRMHGYRPETLVYKDGGTILFRNPNRNEQTYSIELARKWYANNELVYVFRDCNRTAFEILNPTKSVTRALRGNGSVKYFRNRRGDEWR